MNPIKFILTLLLLLYFESNYAQTYIHLSEVISSGGGESTGGIYSNFGIMGESFAHSHMTGGNYSTWIGFYLTKEIINTDISNNVYKIFPNPVRNILNIEFITRNNKVNKIQLLNTQGQIISAVEKDKLNSNNLQIDLSMCSTGIYYLNIQTDKGAIIKKISVIK